MDVPSASAKPSGKVWFIGAGPGDPELITVKGKRLITQADLILYTGSLVPKALFKPAKPEAQLYDSSGMTLKETHSLMRHAVQNGKLVARVHTGDPALFGAVREQKQLLDKEGIANEIVPGVSAAFAAAAAAGVGFTVPEKVQALTITRLSGKTQVPTPQTLAAYAATSCSIAIYLSGANPEGVAEALRQGGLPKQTPIILASRVGWPDEKIIRCTLENLSEQTSLEQLTRQMLFLVLPGEQKNEAPASRLYASDFKHTHRP